MTPKHGFLIAWTAFGLAVAPLIEGGTNGG
jgi:hypothetical protein